MKKFREPLAKIVFFVVLAGGGWSTYAQVCTWTGCPSYNEGEDLPSFPPGQVRVVVTGLPANAPNAVNGAISSLNARSTLNGSGVTFSLNAPATSPTLTINFDSTNAAPTCGGVSNVAGCTDYTNLASPGVVSTATNSIYLGSKVGGINAFDPSALAAYQAGVQSVVEHEMSHSIGIPDATTSGAVTSPFVMQNNTRGTLTSGPCDDTAAIRARNHRNTGSYCLPPGP